MSGRLASLEYNLALLQDCVRRDPESYKDEFLEQYRHLEHTLQLFRLQPTLDPSRLLELINFHSHIAHCYPKETKQLPEWLMDLLSHSGDVLHPHLRLGAAKALTLLRNKNLASPFACLRLFFELSKCRDKELRKFLFTSTIQYVKLLNTKRKDAKVNGQLQNFVLSQLQTAGSSKVMARMALLLLIDLYRRRIWTDAKTVNAIALGGCLSPVTKLSATACKFFLGKELDGEENDESDEDENEKAATTRTIKEVMVGYKAGKKTKGRKRNLERARRAIEKVDKNRNKKNGGKDAGAAALRLLYDPQEFAERLFRKLEQKAHGERFEFRLIVMALLARVIGLHKLQVLNFYTFLLRYLQPRQQEVTKILLFAAQSSHELVPPDSIEVVVRTIVDNFVSDRNSPEAMTVGLNACREILSNCPLAISEDLLRDLVEYKRYRNKNVSMSARGLIQLFRQINPGLLHKRDRGRPTEADKEYEPMKCYGETRAVAGFIPGAECLAKSGNSDSAGQEQNADNESEGSDDDAEGEVDEVSVETDDSEVSEAELDEDEETSEDKRQLGCTEAKVDAPAVDATAIASLVSSSHIFSQEEFRRINKHQVRKRLEPFRKRKLETDSKQKGHKKLRGPNKDGDSAQDIQVSEESEEEEEKGELPKLADIEHFHKRPKMNREARIESVKAGREGREKFGRPKPKGPHVGRTNKKLARNKAFVMVRRKEAKKMKRRSFREKQQALRKYLVNQKKMR